MKSAPKKSSKAKKSKANEESLELSFVGADQLILMVEIHKKILAFRDVMDLAQCNSSASLREVLCNFFLFRAMPAFPHYFLARFTNLCFICHTADGHENPARSSRALPRYHTKKRSLKD